MKSEKNLSSFGDVLLNFLCSASLARVNGKWEGRRIKNTVLAKALLSSNAKKPRRSNRQMLGNHVEALVAKAWINGEVTTEECINVLCLYINDDNESQTMALRRLIDFILERHKNDKTPDEDSRD